MIAVHVFLILQLGKNTAATASPPCIYNTEILCLEFLEFLQVCHKQS